MGSTPPGTCAGDLLKKIGSVFKAGMQVVNKVQNANEKKKETQKKEDEKKTEEKESKSEKEEEKEEKKPNWLNSVINWGKNAVNKVKTKLDPVINVTKSFIADGGKEKFMSLWNDIQSGEDPEDSVREIATSAIKVASDASGIDFAAVDKEFNARSCDKITDIEGKNNPLHPSKRQ